MSNSSTGKGFTISELPHIENIDDADLLLVSDKEGGKYYTKSMTVKQLLQKVVAAVASSPSVMNQLKEKAADVAEEVASNITVQRVQNIVLNNPDIVLDALDGTLNGQLIMGDDK